MDSGGVALSAQATHLSGVIDSGGWVDSGGEALSAQATH